MTDTQTVEPGTTEEQAAKAEALEPAKPAKVVKEPNPCYCQAFEVRGKDEDEVFATGCEATTKSTFAQGHDARLVSFLVDGYFDGYTLHTVVNGTHASYATPEDAARTASEPLAQKAKKATENRKAKLDAKTEAAAAKEKVKAEKAAAKLKAAADKAAAKKNGGEVVAGSQTGDLPELAEGQARIKVGRYEYVATVDESGVATYTDGKGETQTRERDGYQLLQS